MSFHAIDDLNQDSVDSWEDLRYIIIDKAHKCCVDHVVQLLSRVKNKITLILFGDLDEHKLHFRRGGGE